MLHNGMIFRTATMVLKVTRIGSSWIKCDYWDGYNKQWKPRGCTENKAKVESKIDAGEYRIIKKF